MCLIAFAWGMRQDWPLVLIGNRDEVHDRPTLPAARWGDAPDILGGLDLSAGGAWLGVSERGRLAAVTNYRQPAPPSTDALSRGWIVRDLLHSDAPARADALSLHAQAARYRPFNALLITGAAAWALTNRPEPDCRPLDPGLYGLSNGGFDAPWPKTTALKRALAAWLESDLADPEPAFAALADESRAPDSALPDTGVGLERERLVAPAFIRSPAYGTRASSVITVARDGAGLLYERRFGPDGVFLGETRLTFHWPASKKARARNERR